MTNAETLREYRAIRAEAPAPYYDRSGAPFYNARRALEWARGRVRWAAEAERIAHAWANAEAAGLVRFRVEFDDECRSFEDMTGDTFRPECHPEIPANVIAREAKAERERIDAEGVFGIVAEYRTHPGAEWTHGASVWGFIGDDWKGYDEAEAKGEALTELRDALRARPRPCPTCGGRPS